MSFDVLFYFSPRSMALRFCCDLRCFSLVASSRLRPVLPSEIASLCASERFLPMLFLAPFICRFRQLAIRLSVRVKSAIFFAALRNFSRNFSIGSVMASRFRKKGVRLHSRLTLSCF
jgi:hypothetical protein